MGKKIKIYLCDYVHNYLGAGTYVFPLNVGYISAYAHKFFPNEIVIKLFKYPEDFIKQCKRNIPDVIGFSHYTWNADLNNRLSKWIKSVSPESIVVFGGPNVNHSLAGYKRFFITYDSVDFYIPYQGESPFVNLLRKIFDNGLNLPSLKTEPIDGIIFYDKNNDSIIQGQSIPNIKDLDVIPSPYLTGILDEFFDSYLIPILETNRGCPYTCTFCAQGFSSHNQLNLFSLKRVKDELNYIFHKVKNTNLLYFADANFGIVGRDIEIAKYIAKLTKETNYPRKFNASWAKNQPKLFEIAKILECSNLIISLQSLDEGVLENVKRTNIKLSVFKDIVDRINTLGGMCGTEIMLGLPGETKESHMQTIRELFDWDVPYITCYNALVLEGTEMSLLREKGNLQLKTKFRLIDSSFGKYSRNIISFEAEEGIRATSAISEEGILFFRPVHWLIQFLWNYRFYYDTLKYLKFLQINPLDYILRLIDESGKNSTPIKIKKIFSDFKQEAQKEWFDSPQELRAYYSRPEQFEILKKGQYGKMNGKYIFRVLAEMKEDFNKFLYNSAINYSPICRSRKQIFKDIFVFLFTSTIDFKCLWNGAYKERMLFCKYDILRWRNSGYKKGLEEFYCPEGIKFLFYLSDEQKRSLEILLKQYKHKNKNVTLRKMSEFMNIKDFFYRVKYI